MVIFHKTWILLICLLFLVACRADISPDFTVTQLDLPAEVVDFPVTESSVFWLPDGKLLIRIDLADTTYQANESVSYLLRDSNSFETRHFPVETNCDRYRYHISGLLPDGRLGLVKQCNFYDKPNQAPTQEQTFILAYDWNTGEAEQLVAQSIPPLGVSWFSWNPSMTRAVQQAGSLLSTIIWLTSEKARPMNVTIQEGSRQWNLADNYWLMLNGENDTSRIGIAKSPAWSPDGRQIAFFASLDAIGQSGSSRATGEYKLYLMDAETQQPEPVLEDIYFGYHLTWSPDGRWLAFTGQRRGYCSSNDCLWIFSPEQRELILVTDDVVFGLISWSPDGTQLVTTRRCEDCTTTSAAVELNNGESMPLPTCHFPRCYEIVIYDVGRLTLQP